MNMIYTPRQFYESFFDSKNRACRTHNRRRHAERKVADPGDRSFSGSPRPKIMMLQNRLERQLFLEAFISGFESKNVDSCLREARNPSFADRCPVYSRPEPPSDLPFHAPAPLACFLTPSWKVPYKFLCRLP